MSESLGALVREEWAAMIAAERLHDDPRILAGDRPFFEQVEADARRLSREWTAYAARKGPRPRTGRLP